MEHEDFKSLKLSTTIYITCKLKLFFFVLFFSSTNSEAFYYSIFTDSTELRFVSKYLFIQNTHCFK